MKKPQWIKSTQPKQSLPCVMQPDLPIAIGPPLSMDAAPIHNVFLHQPLPHLIDNDCNELIANVICFGSFADLHSGTIYNNLTGNFQFMLFDKIICYLLMYHYESNAFLATSIASLDDVSIFNAYKLNFVKLMRKDYQTKLNVMDN